MQEYYYDDINDADQCTSAEDYEIVIKNLKADLKQSDQNYDLLYKKHNEEVFEVKKFLASLLHPEELGYAVTQEVRDLARNLFNELGGSND